MDNKVIYDAEDTQLIQPVKTYKMIAFRGKVVFPGQAVHFEIGRASCRERVCLYV